MKKHVVISVIQKVSAGIICFSLILSMIPLPAIRAESLEASMSASGSPETSRSGELDSSVQPTTSPSPSPTITPSPSDEFTQTPTSIPTPTTIPEPLDFGGEGPAGSGKIRVKTIILSLAKQIYSSKERVSVLVQNASFDEINVSLVYVN
jgi:hypothetical protein